MKKVILIIILLISTIGYAQQPAFPGAEGYGKYSVGGRGGVVYRVTNLNDSGAGSLRAFAQDSTGARIIIFDVGGRINLSSAIIITNPYLTIAGQHSVGDGITLSIEGTPNQALIKIHTNDVIIRYITFRRSEFEVNDTNSDGLIIAYANDIIIDHCSFSWASDENINIYDYDGDGIADTYNITIQNCLIDTAWGGTDKGLLASGGIDRLTFYNLLLTSLFQRQPLIKNETGNYVTAETYFEIINTVTFVGKYHAQFVNNVVESGLKHLNYINNLCIDSFLNRNMLYLHNTPFDVSIFAQGNISPFRTSITSPVDWDEEWSVLQAGGGAGDVEIPPTTDYRVTTPKSTPIINDGVTLIDALDLWDSLKTHVGASLPTRDSEDARAINDVETETDTAPTTSGTFPTIANGTPLTDTSGDGMPDAWKTGKGLNPATDDSSYAWGNGYIGVEEYINELDGSAVNVPQITRTDSNPTTIEVGGTYTPPTGTWTDVEDGNGNATVGGDTVDINVIDTYNVTLFHTDTDSNTGTLNISVDIVSGIVNATSVLVSPSTDNVSISGTTQLSVAFTPSNTTDKTGVWSSADELLATVGFTGLVVGVAIGEVIITFTSNDGSFTSDSAVTVVESLPATGAVITSLVLSGSDYILTYFQPSNTETPTGEYDTILDDTDQSDNSDFTEFTRTYTGLNTSIEHTFQLESRYIGLDPPVFPLSNEAIISPNGNVLWVLIPYQKRSSRRSMKKLVKTNF